jgi:uncharacterized protein
MGLGLLTIHLMLPGCTSLKEKRGRLKPLIHRLHREFNISVAEIDQQDSWQQAVIGCAMVSSDKDFTQRALQEVVSWVERFWPDVSVLEDHLELL